MHVPWFECSIEIGIVIGGMHALRMPFYGFMNDTEMHRLMKATKQEDSRTMFKIHKRNDNMYLVSSAVLSLMECMLCARLHSCFHEREGGE
jgi:hypothetical protein